jgi:glycosyltransferase involved in cell wall biosynthesis
MTSTRDVTVGIKTFLRTPKLRLCMESLAAHPWRAVIVADDGPIDDERQRLYSEFSSRIPLSLLKLDFDTGLAAGRNEIVRHCQTDYLLMLDDDQTVPANIGMLAEVLDEDRRLGGVSCIWIERDGPTCSACDIGIEGTRIVKRIVEDKAPHATSSGQRYVIFDFIPNSTLFRTDCLRELPWDPFYKIGKEHLDFYLSHKQLGKWLFAVSLDVKIGHHPEQSSGEYRKFRGGERLRVSEEYFLKKFGATSVVQESQYMEPADGKSFVAVIARRLRTLRDLLEFRRAR